MGGDSTTAACTTGDRSLNPPRPCGRGLPIVQLFPVRSALNPPRPCGRGLLLHDTAARVVFLKSTPPVWAGTANRIKECRALSALNPPRPCGRGQIATCRKIREETLKSTPPVWAGTKLIMSTLRVQNLKSTPPVWAGTAKTYKTLKKNSSDISRNV